MPNLNPPASFDKPSVEARAYVRRELADLAWALGVQTEILDRYLLLGQDEMAIHTIRQIRAVFKALYEIGRRLHELKRLEEASHGQ